MNKKIIKTISIILGAILMFQIHTHAVFAIGSSYDLHNLSERVAGIADAYFKISIEKAWDAINVLPRTFAPLSIGILDSGTDISHPEFSEVNLGSTPSSAKTDRDPDGHGTQVAGIIGANNISSTSSANYVFPQMNGILSGAHNLNYTLEIRKKSDIPIYTLFDARSKINNLIKSGARIINLSLESFLPNIVDIFFSRVFDKNREILFVVAAGNSGLDAESIAPARLGDNFDNVITVGATDLNDNRWVTSESASNFGSAVGISAPGEQIYAPKPFISPLDPTDYDPNFTDTSASAPMVTGVAGLIKAIKPELTPAQIKQILIETGDPISTDKPIGPRLNALKAVCHPLVGLNCSQSQPSDLISYWPADGNALDAQDVNNGTLMNGASFGEGKIGRAFNLDGIDDYIDLGVGSNLNFPTDDFTVNFWANFRNLDKEQVMIEKYIEGTPRTGWTFTKLSSNSLQLRLHLANTPTSTDNILDVTPPEIPTDTWINAGFTREDNNFTIYWNGIALGSASFPGVNLGTNASLKLGHRGNPNDPPPSNSEGSWDTRNFYLNGLIDEVKIFNRSLSSEEVEGIYGH